MQWRREYHKAEGSCNNNIGVFLGYCNQNFSVYFLHAILLLSRVLHPLPKTIKIR